MDRDRPPIMAAALRAALGTGTVLAGVVMQSQRAMVITDTSLPDHPIVFANVAFLRLTGYRKAEVLGRNCRFLQGPQTDPGTVAVLRRAIQQRQEIAVKLLNYRKDGAPFWNALRISPLQGIGDDIRYFVGAQRDITAHKRGQAEIRKQIESSVAKRTGELQHLLAATETQLRQKELLLREVNHRVRNSLQLVSAALQLQAHAVVDPHGRQLLEESCNRVIAIAQIHQSLSQTNGRDRIEFCRYLHQLCAGVARPPATLTVTADQAELPTDQAISLALIANELVTNALKHARPEGGLVRIGVTFRACPDRLEITVADDGQGLPVTFDPATGGGFGWQLIRMLAHQIKGHLTLRPSTSGACFTLTVLA